MLNMLIMGPAGSGKGTMSELIVKSYNIPHISTGDMFRYEIGNNTELGIKAKEYIDKGCLVPDEVTISMVSKRLAQNDCQKGYLLDGFPRSLPQAKAYDEAMEKTVQKVDLVINLVIDEEVLASRIVNRRICKDCGAIYNLTKDACAHTGVCEKCHGQLYQRSDDTIEALKKRMSSYEKETAPVVEYYRNKGIVYDVDASKSKNDVFSAVDEIIKKHQK